MNKKQQEILDEVYENYCKSYPNVEKTFQYEGSTIDVRKMTKEEFVNECKTDTEFSERWELKIEERELSLEEKEWQLEKTNCINDIENDRIIYGHEWEKYIQEQYEGIQSNQGIKIPTKLITITYNDKTIISYEHIG